MELDKDRFFSSVRQALSGNSPWREVFGLILLAFGYWLAIRLGLLLVTQPERVAAIWPASGVALAALLLGDKRKWGKILVVIFIVNALGNWSGGNPLLVSLGFALVNALEPLFCAWTLTHLFKSRILFDRAAEVAALLGAAVLCNGVTALLGAAVPAFAFNAPFLKTWEVWWAADGLGIILVTPVIVSWNFAQNKSPFSGKRHPLELAFFTLTLILFATLLFGRFTLAEKPILRNYMLFPLLIWLAFRFNTRGMAHELLLFATIAIWNTLQGRGIFGFADQSLTNNLVALQIYLMVASFSGLLLSAIVSDRRHAEETLRIAEAKYHAIFENAPVGIFQSTPQGRFLSVNPAMAKIYGYASPQDMLETVKDISRQIYVNAAEREQFKSALQAGREVVEFIGHDRRKDGKDIWTQAIARMETNERGETLYYEGFITDITERKEIEEALRESTEKYRLVADFTYDWEAWHAPDGSYLYVSPSCKRITGYAAEEFIADADLIVKITHPEDRANILEHFQLVADEDKKKDIIFDFRILAKSGEVRWINHICTAVYGADGKWLGRRESNRDITARKQSEAVLRSRLRLGQYADKHTVDEALQYTLNEAEALTASEIAFFHTLSADQKTLTQQMWSANTLQIARTTEVNNHQDEIQKAGVWADCIHKREPVIYNDYAGLPHRKGMPEGHAPIRRILTLPIFHNDMIAAIVGVGNKPTNYDYQDVKIVRELAELAWDVILRKRSEEETRQTKEALEKAYHSLEEALEREKALSRTDPLIGINNRRYLFELAEHEATIAARHRVPLSIIMFDIDFFKKVNDTFGHDSGDLVLQRVIESARVELRASDVIGRYGGEEFVVILPLTTAQQAYPLAERIRARVETLRVPTQKEDAKVTLSIGIVETNHAQPSSVDDLIRRADEAMYAAKQAGRNCISIYAWK